MQSRIEQKVMAGVAVVYAGRLLLSRLALELYVLAASGVALWQFTWVHRVFENWAHVGLSGTWGYVTYAVVHTHLPTQMALAAAAAAGILFVVDAIATLARPHHSLLLRQ
jgi:hypothetical protein